MRSHFKFDVYKYIKYKCFYCVGPSYSVNGGPWTKIGFGPYYCHYTESSLFNCYQYSSYYRQSPYYCSPYKDTVMLNCSEQS